MIAVLIAGAVSTLISLGVSMGLGLFISRITGGANKRARTIDELRSTQARLAAAERESVDLIVIATHGYTGVKHMLLGSTTEQVVRMAKCPVLTVRASE